jgi:hypothetical protein
LSLAWHACFIYSQIKRYLQGTSLKQFGRLLCGSESKESRIHSRKIMSI